MKKFEINRIAALGVVMAMTLPGTWAQGVADKYAPLRTALAEKKKEAVVLIEDARFLVDEYDRFLEDPEIDSFEKPSLRKALIEEEARLKQLQSRVFQLQTAIHQLRSMPRDQEITAGTLKATHEGLGELGSQGKAVWDQIIEERDAAVEVLTADYREALAGATLAYEELNTAERANRILLDALDFHRPDATDAEFQVSRGLPAIKTAVELGFGLTPKSEDPSRHAQTTLIALVGYRQFFWDHGDGGREQSAEDGLVTDKARNIMGVADGDVLASDAVAESQSHYFYLSDHAKEPFNGRIRAIWGTEGSASITWWNHQRAQGFHRACSGVSTTESDVLVHNEGLFALLNEIDGLINEKERAARVIQDVHAAYEEKFALARSFDGKEALSSAHFNALRLAQNSERTFTRFEAAHKLLDKQLAECSEDDWKPNAKGIVASAQMIGVIHRRFLFAAEVKEELAALLR